MYIIICSVYIDPQACPTGYRVLNSSICEPCDSPATARDYLYLVFICLVTLFLRVTVTTVTNWSKLKSLWMLYVNYIYVYVNYMLCECEQEGVFYRIINFKQTYWSPSWNMIIFTLSKLAVSACNLHYYK